MIETWRAAPAPAQAGLALLGAGLVVDVALHGLGSGDLEHLGHAVVLAGMVLTLVAVVLDGIPRSRPRSRS